MYEKTRKRIGFRMQVEGGCPVTHPCTNPEEDCVYSVDAETASCWMQNTEGIQDALLLSCEVQVYDLWGKEMGE